MTADKKKLAGISTEKRTSMVSLRIGQGLKREIRTMAKKQGRSLSSLIEHILQNWLEKQKGDLPHTAQVDRRRFARKDVVLPARWRFQGGNRIVEHDVLIRNVSAGGVYTEYLNGRQYPLFEKNQAWSLELAVRLPGLEMPVALECVAVRFHVTEDCLGVGLRYTESADSKSLAALRRFLA